MLKFLKKFNFSTITKSITLAMAVAFSFSLNAKAEEVNYETLKVSCDPFSSYDLISNCYSYSTAKKDELITQAFSERRELNNAKKYYVGLGLGAGFPSGGIALNSDNGDGVSFDYATGFFGSLFGGIKFNKNIAAELEFLLGLGGGDTDEFDGEVNSFIEEVRNSPEAERAEEIIEFNEDLEADLEYSAFALYISPKFNLPLSNSLSVFISPGIGLSQTNVNYNADSNIGYTPDGTLAEDPNNSELINESISEINESVEEANAEFDSLNTDRDFSRLGVSFQIKAGVSFQVSKTIGVFGQVHYVTLPTESDDEFDIDSINAFSTQGGLTFNF